MAEALGITGSIVGIVAFGLKFVTTVQTYAEAVGDTNDNLRAIILDVSSTSSTLKQIHEFIVQDRDAADKVTVENGGVSVVPSDAGLQDVMHLASQCKQVYIAIVKLTAKETGAPVGIDGDVSLDDMNLDSLNVSTLRKLKWPLKELRVRKIRDELRWLKVSLLLNLRVMELARSKMSSPRQLAGVIDTELALQATIGRLIDRRLRYAKHMVRRRDSKLRPPRSLSSSRTSSTGSNIIVLGGGGLGESIKTGPKVRRQGDHGAGSVKGKENTTLNSTNVIKGRQAVRIPYIPAQPNQHTQVLAPNQTETSPPHQPINTVLASGEEEQEPRELRPEEQQLPEANAGVVIHERVTKGKWRVLLRSFFRITRIAQQQEVQVPHEFEPEFLMAYTIEERGQNPWQRLFLGRQHLTGALGSILMRRVALWNQYMQLSIERRQVVDRLTNTVNRSSSHLWTCMAIQTEFRIGSDIPFLIVFYALGSPVAPVSIICEGGGRAEIPYEESLTWLGITQFIQQTFRHAQAIRNNQYRLIGPESLWILPDNWLYNVRPGLVVNVELMPTGPPLRLDVLPSPYINNPQLQPPMGYRRSMLQSKPPPISAGLPSGVNFVRAKQRRANTIQRSDADQPWGSSTTSSRATSATSASETEEDEEAAENIVDVEEAQRMAELSLGALLVKWTNIAGKSSNGVEGDGLADDTESR